MIKNLTIVINLDNPAILDSILKLLEPFQEEISISVRDDNARNPIIMAHIGHITHPGQLEMALLRESERGIIMVCADNFHPPKRGDLAEMFTDKLKEMSKSIEIMARKISTEKEEQKNDTIINQQQLKHWGAKQTSNYQSKKIFKEKFIRRCH